MNAKELQAQLKSLSNPHDAAALAHFFKTGPGDYGEGDVFLGVRAPAMRRLAKQFQSLSLPQILTLLRSKIHEERSAALAILVLQTAKAEPETQKRIYELYLANTQYVNNWDLVDLSAPQLVGAYLENRSRQPLHRLAQSTWLWDRRIAIVATFHFIRRGDFDDTLHIAQILLGDQEDLLHKAVGWMLREVGKRDQDTLEAFLEKRGREMPRTMLRYAIEKFPEKKRQFYLKRK